MNRVASATRFFCANPAGQANKRLFSRVLGVWGYLELLQAVVFIARRAQVAYPENELFHGFTITGNPRDRAALDALLPIVYGELKALAAHYLRNERPNHTLQPTALVHEAYLRLSQQRDVDWSNKTQLFGVAAQMMRRILVNHAEARNAEKRGGDVTRVTLDESVSWEGTRDVDIVALDEALTRLAQLDVRQERVVELRFFAGLSIEETAQVLDISPATVKREWTMAKAWLRNELATR